MAATETIPSCYAKAIPLSAGQKLRIINPAGTQVVVCWAFLTPPLSSPPNTEARAGAGAAYPYTYMSMSHTRAALKRLTPQVGDCLVSNERKKMITLVEDTSCGIHDTLVAGCDRWRYMQLGADPAHRNCEDNLLEALEEAGLPQPTSIPDAISFFMNVAIHEDHKTISFSTVKNQPGSYIEFRAEVDVVIVVSACPQDVLIICSGPLTHVNYQVFKDVEN